MEYLIWNPETDTQKNYSQIQKLITTPNEYNYFVVGKRIFL